MYKIKVINTETGKIWWEYGFKKYLFKRFYFFFNERDNNNHLIYKVIEIYKLNFSLKILKKCLTNHADMI